MSVQRIQEAVARRLSEEHPRIVATIFNTMCKNHNDTSCECEACQLLKPYLFYIRKYNMARKRWESEGDISYTELSYAKQARDYYQARRLELKRYKGDTKLIPL